jgi:hypothetical protein
MTNMQPLPLTQHAQRLAAQLAVAEHVQPTVGPAYHVASLGSGFYFAYEQLRNAAQYREHHLLLRSAIERYLHRYVRLEKFEPAGADLVTELTQSGYLKNDAVSVPVVEQIDKVLEEYSDIYHGLRAASTDGGTSTYWLYQIASVHIETLISPDPKGNVFMQFAYEHYYYAIDRKYAGKDPITDHQYRIALFCAVQRAIFKSDISTTRFYCVSLSLPDLAKQPIEQIIELNALIDDAYQSPAANRLARIINRYGAPVRILRELLIENSSTDTLLENRAEAISRAKEVCASEYTRISKNLNARIIKTIFFIFITKTLIGISVEVPYDLILHGEIAWTPLVTNIILPVLYMLTISSRIHTPSRQNTEVVAGYIDRILYDHEGAPVTYKPKRRVSSASLNATFSAVYAIGFIGSLALLVWILHQVGFNLANGMIFFLFFSAVSFLGFRLRQSAQELAMLDEREGVLPALADFLSTPFVRVGHWLSDTYAQANIVTTILDIAIEMPIKTSLRLLRQWVSFMRDKQEEL